jgi:ornithine cyclodeaminase/alanine dehydrogenase-like protein (mu-crystallin family)
MRVHTLAEIERVATPIRTIEAVRAALIAHAEAKTHVSAPTHLMFSDSDGDAHVKAGYIAGAPTFTVKLATGFYRNHELGLPNNHGVVVVASSQTGEVLAILADNGWLTAWRTAAASALATDALSRPGPLTLAIIGTGRQARLAADWHRRLRPLRRVIITGRRPEAVASLAQDIGAQAAATIVDALAAADAVVTATASTEPLFAAPAVRPGTHITALGADLPGKQELPIDLLSGALLVADDLNQTLDHGDLSFGMRAGLVDPTDVHLLGHVLRDGIERPPGAITIADLTGVGALDAAVAEMVTLELERQYR